MRNARESIIRQWEKIEELAGQLPTSPSAGMMRWWRRKGVVPERWSRSLAMLCDSRGVVCPDLKPGVELVDRRRNRRDEASPRKGS